MAETMMTTAMDKVTATLLLDIRFLPRRRRRSRAGSIASRRPESMRRLKLLRLDVFALKQGMWSAWPKISQNALNSISCKLYRQENDVLHKGAHCIRSERWRQEFFSSGRPLRCLPCSRPGEKQASSGRARALTQSLLQSKR